MTRTTILLATTLAAAGCGASSSTAPVTPAGAAADPGGQAASDATAAAIPSLDFAIPEIAIAETSLMPRALTRLEWPAVVPDRALAAQRRRVKRARGDRAEREQLTLATILWAGDAADATSKAEARELLRTLAKAGASQESTLVMLSIAELTLGDTDGARAALDDLIIRFPRSKKHWGYRAARASLDLNAPDRTRARQIIDGADLESDSTPAEVFYVVGWLAYRDGDYPTAYTSLSRAAANWQDLDTWDFLRDELYRFAALAGTSHEDASARLDTMLKGAPKRAGGTKTTRTRTIVSGGKRVVVTQQTDVTYSRSWELVQLASAYSRTGNLAAAQALLPDSLAVSDFPAATAAGAIMLAGVLDATGRAEDAASRVVASWKALTTAEEQYEDAELAALQTRILAEGSMLAEGYAATYAGTGDVGYARAAKALYGWLGDTEEYAEQKTAAAMAAELEGATGGAKNPIEWNEGMAAALARRGRLALRACYFKPLQADPALSGTVTLSIKLVAGDREVGVTPEAGESGLPGVATCVANAAREWWMPSAPAGRPVTLTVPVVFSATPVQR